MIHVASLTRRYGEALAVDDVSFTIGAGEIVGLLGHNGAGKTTVMKMLTGYLEPTAGSVRIDGIDLATDRRAAQARIGYLPESDPLYPEMTVVDYLDYAAGLHGVPSPERAARVRDALRRTELDERAAQSIGTLSRGYRQRVGVAQALLHRPKVLILDEPTNGLDPTQVQHMRGLIRELAHEATVILSTHILQEVQALCDRVIILRRGQKVLDDRLAPLNTGRSLQLEIDAAPDAALPVLRAVPGIAAAKGDEPASPAGATWHYALALAPDHTPPQVAPALARAVVAQGWALHRLQPERRDLETLFREMSTA